jgi:hypothetical protein
MKWKKVAIVGKMKKCDYVTLKKTCLLKLMATSRGRPVQAKVKKGGRGWLLGAG